MYNWGYTEGIDQTPDNGSWNSQFAKHSATPLKVHQPATIKAWCFLNFAPLRENTFHSFVQGLIGKCIELGGYPFIPSHYSQ